MNLRIWDVLLLRLRFGNLSEDGYAELLESALDGLGKFREVKLRKLIVARGLSIRPTLTGRSAVPPENMRWKYWVSMAIRYFPALAQKNGLPLKPTPIKEIYDLVQHDKELKQALLFADSRLAYSVLEQLPFSNEWRKTIPGPSTDEDAILGIISYHLRHKEPTDRQVLNWSTELFDEWASALKDYLQVIPLVWLSLAAGAIFNFFVGTENKFESASFAIYVKRFKEAGLDWALGQAIGYHNEQKHSFRQAASSASLFLFGAIGFAVLFTSAIVAIRLNANPFIILVTGVGAIIFIGIFLYALIRIFVLLITAYNRAGFQLQTLSEIEAMFLSEPDQ